MGGLPELRFDRAGFLLLEQLAQLAVWALIGWQSRLPELWLTGREVCLGVSAFPLISICNIAIYISCTVATSASSSNSSSSAKWGDLLLKSSIPLADQKGLGFMEMVRLIQNMCKMILFCTSKVERHPFDAVSFWLGPFTGSWGFPSHSGSSCCSLCRDWEKEGSDSPPFTCRHSSFMDTCWGCIFTPEKLFYTTQLCNSS